MYNATARFAAIMTSALYVLAGCAVAMAVQCAVTDVLWPPRPQAILTAQQVSPVYRAHLGWTDQTKRIVHRTTLELNITADFSSVFSWNTKVLYVFVVAEYSNPTFRRNELVLWDTIVNDTDEAPSRFTMLQQREYPLDDIGDRLVGANVRLRVRYQTMQYSGYAPMWDVPGSEVSVQIMSPSGDVRLPELRSTL